MAEGEDKKNQQTSQNNPVNQTGDSTGAQKPKRKRRRRPRKKKTPQQNEPIKKDTFLLDENTPKVEEPVIKTEVEAPVEEFLASDDAAPKPSTPEPPAPEPAASEPAGPVGWDQLKDAIKEDHEKTEEQLAAEPAPEPIPEAIPAEISTEPAPEEVIEPEVTSAPEPIPFASGDENLAADDEAEKKEIIRIIVKYTVGGCAVIAILAGIFLFNIPGTIYNIASDLLDDGETKQAQETEQPTQKPDTTPDTTPKSDSELTDGTGAAIISGGQVPRVRKVPTSIQTLFYIGFPEVTTSDSDRINTYLKVLNELQNGFETDINQLLDSSSSRARALEVHLRELNGLLAEAQFTYENLNEEADDIKVEFNRISTQKDILENAFFVSLEKLAAFDSNKVLNDFIDVSVMHVSLKAEFNALTKVSGMFDVAIRNMEARIKDIEANKQALVTGVKIVDIKGSDLDLIIQEGEL